MPCCLKSNSYERKWNIDIILFSILNNMIKLSNSAFYRSWILLKIRASTFVHLRNKKLNVHEISKKIFINKNLQLSNLFIVEILTFWSCCHLETLLSTWLKTIYTQYGVLYNVKPQKTLLLSQEIPTSKLYSKPLTVEAARRTCLFYRD